MPDADNGDPRKDMETSRSESEKEQVQRAKELLEMMSSPPDDGWRDGLADPQTLAQATGWQVPHRSSNQAAPPEYENIGTAGLAALRAEREKRQIEWDEKKRALSVQAWQEQVASARVELLNSGNAASHVGAFWESIQRVISSIDPAPLHLFSRVQITPWKLAGEEKDLKDICKSIDADPVLCELASRLSGEPSILPSRDNKKQRVAAAWLIALHHQEAQTIPHWGDWRRWLVEKLNTKDATADDVRDAYSILIEPNLRDAKPTNAAQRQLLSAVVHQSFVRYVRVWLLNVLLAAHDNQWVAHPLLDVACSAVGMSGDPTRMIASHDGVSWTAAKLTLGKWSTLSEAQMQSLSLPYGKHIAPIGFASRLLEVTSHEKFSVWLGRILNSQEFRTLCRELRR
jgi:hypothetical protein